MAIIRTEKLTEEEIQERLIRYAQTRDIHLRSEIVLQYDNLVESIARRFLGAGEPVEDLVQEGYIGLIGAVDLYNASKGVKFSTYATHFVIGQIKHYLRDKGKIIKEPAWLQELNQRMARVIESLSHQLGRQPTAEEIAPLMGMSEDAVTEMLTTREVFKVSSLDGGDRDDSSNFPTDAEKVKNQKCVTFQLPLEDKIVLKAAMDRLKTIEQTVIHHFFYLDLNQTEIAKKLGISCNYVSHILRNSTKKLKKILMTEELKDTQIQVQQLSKRLQHQVDLAEKMTVVDPVTELYNRRYLLDRLDEEVSRAVRYRHEVGLVFIKLDFQNAAGGTCLRTDDIFIKIATTIQKAARKMDVLCRYNEDIFCLILPHTGAQSEVVCARMQDRLQNLSEDYAKSRPGLQFGVRTAWAAFPDNAATSAEMLGRVCAQLIAPQDANMDRAA